MRYRDWRFIKRFESFSWKRIRNREFEIRIIELWWERFWDREIEGGIEWEREINIRIIRGF